MSLELRPYQLDAIARLRRAYAQGAKRVLLVAPTGSGKTVVAAAIIGLALDRSRRVLFGAHRHELLQQTLAKLSDVGVRAGLIQAGQRGDASALVQVASIQTLLRRELPGADLYIRDEAHHISSDGDRRIAAHYGLVLGLTATPWRQDGRGLGEDFDAVVVAATPAELAAQGHLVAPRVFAYASPDLKGIRIQAGDYNPRMLELACDRQELMGSVVREYQLHGQGEPAIVFPVSVAHSQHLVAQFAAAGFSAAHLDGTTPADERDTLLQRFREGRLQVVSSAGVLAEGFDAPVASVCILARPTMSQSLYLQQVGRVLRPFPGKRRALVHDHAGCALRHGLPLDERDYTLTSDKKRPAELHMACPMCMAVVLKAAPACPVCGGLLRPPVEPSQRRELRIRSEVERLDMDAIRARRLEQGLHHMSDADLARIATCTRARAGMEYLRLRQLCSSRGFPPQYAVKYYRQTFGAEPDFTPAELARLQPASRPLVTPPARSARAAS